MHPHTRSFMLAGEGSFHQLHGGVTTSEVEERETILNRQREQLTELLGESFRSPTVEPILLGKVPGPALRYLKHSVERGMHRVQRCAERQEDMYADERLKEGARRRVLGATSGLQ
ncbi:hypothetical protein OMD46_00095 [Pseudomonas sp. MDMC_285]|nr:hypothetical protein [Pseudomonas sp. MDMC_285]